MSSPIPMGDLTKAWVHAHEEDSGSVIVYRPADYPLPPSRGRHGFQLKPNGALVLTGPGPTDRAMRTAGTWQLVGDRLELSADDQQLRRVLRIKAVDPERLVVEKESLST